MTTSVSASTAFFSASTPLVGEALETVLEVVGEGGAEGRVVGGVEVVAAVADAGGLLDIAQGVSHREEDGLFLEGLLGDLTKRRVVVEDVEAATEGAEHEIVLGAVDVHVADLDGRQTALELHPVRSLVDRGVDAELGADERAARV